MGAERRVTAEALTAAAYAPYGEVVSCDRDDAPAKPANMGTAARRNFLVDLVHDRPGARANLCAFRCAPHTEWPKRLGLLEKHPRSTQVFVPMRVSRYVAAVALGGDAPDLATLRAFVCVAGQGVSYRPGVWHHPMITLDDTADFACLVWEDGGPDDCVVHALDDVAVISLA